MSHLLIKDIEFLAKACHNASRAVLVHLGQSAPPEWDGLSWEEQQDHYKLIQNEFNDKELSLAALNESNRSRLVLEGYEYGPVHNERNKTSPIVVAWRKLDPVLKAVTEVRRSIMKDYLEYKGIF